MDPITVIGVAPGAETVPRQHLLHGNDVMSMAHGLEVRVPTLDRRLIELVAPLLEYRKLSPRKPLLVNAIGSDLVEAICRRPKQGFNFPWTHWPRHDFPPTVAEAFGYAGTFSDRGINLTVVQRLWKAFGERRIEMTWSRVWALVVLREWAVRLRAYIG